MRLLYLFLVFIQVFVCIDGSARSIVVEIGEQSECTFDCSTQLFGTPIIKQAWSRAHPLENAAFHYFAETEIEELSENDHSKFDIDSNHSFSIFKLQNRIESIEFSFNIQPPLGYLCPVEYTILYQVFRL